MCRLYRVIMSCLSTFVVVSEDSSVCTTRVAVAVRSARRHHSRPITTKHSIVAPDISGASSFVVSCRSHGYFCRAMCSSSNLKMWSCARSPSDMSDVHHLAGTPNWLALIAGTCVVVQHAPSCLDVALSMDSDSQRVRNISD